MRDRLKHRHQAQAPCAQPEDDVALSLSKLAHIRLRQILFLVEFPVQLILQDQGRILKDARPTAVNLSWAVDRVIKAVRVEMFRARQEDPMRLNANAGARRLAEAAAREAKAILQASKP